MVLVLSLNNHKVRDYTCRIPNVNSTYKINFDFDWHCTDFTKLVTAVC